MFGGDSLRDMSIQVGCSWHRNLQSIHKIAWLPRVVEADGIAGLVGVRTLLCWCVCLRSTDGVGVPHAETLTKK